MSQGRKATQAATGQACPKAAHAAVGRTCPKAARAAVERTLAKAAYHFIFLLCFYRLLFPSFRLF
jgi:hypothetical protein